MMLGAGTRMGRYEVMAAIGAGGMGEVYRARDPKLDRTVALKILPSAIAANPQLRLRFEREGRAISKLTHPHICTLYDVGNHEGVEYLVMEYLEGETLAERLRKGRLPLAQALKIAREIVQALDTAHHQGIVHRDLKPANVMLTRSGAKLLDFGLAKLRDPGEGVLKLLDSRSDHRETQSSDSPDAPTLETPITRARTILGTVQYMAPEQIEGHEADARTDIFAFGVLLYEMVTGRRAFEMASEASLIGAILMQEPRPIREIDAMLPPPLDQLVRRCIAKAPDERWQHARDVLWQLSDLGDGVGGTREPVPARAWLTHALWAAALIAAVVATGLLISRTERLPASLSGPVRAGIDLPARDGLVLGYYPSFALAPNGSEIVFRSSGDGTPRLHRRRLDTFDVQQIPGTENGHTPFFSPDGQSLGFLVDSKVHRVPLSGGRPIEIATVPALTPGSPGAAWGDDGTIVLAAGLGGLMRVPAGGGTVETLTKPDAGRNEDSHYAPQFLPGGQDLLFMVRTRNRESRAALLSLRTRTWQWIDGLTNIVGAAQYVATGHLLYSEAQANGMTHLRAAPLDVAGHKVSGGVLQLDEVHAQTSGDVGLSHFALSASGVVAYVQGRPAARSLVKVSRDGSAVSLTESLRAYRYPRVSPNSRQIAVVVADGTASDIQLVDAADGKLTPLTATGGNTHPAWTSDGRRVTFASVGSGSQGYDLFSILVGNGARVQPERLLAREGGQFPTSWSPAAPLLAFYELSNATARDILVWSKDGGAVRVRATPSNERFAAFSPNGRWLAYVSDQSGRDEVWVHAYLGDRPDVMVSSDGGTEPVWSPDGRELYFRKGAELRAVATDPDKGPTGPTTVVFSQAYELSPAEVGRPNYDVLPDGTGFVMVRGEPPVTHLRVILNWLDELRAQLPGAGR